MNPGTYDDLLGKYAGKAPDDIRAAAERASARGDEAAHQGQNAVAAQWYDVAYALDAMAEGQEQYKDKCMTQDIVMRIEDLQMVLDRDGDPLVIYGRDGHKDTLVNVLHTARAEILTYRQEQEQPAAPDAPRYTDEDVARLTNIVRRVNYCLESGTINDAYTQRTLQKLLVDALAPFAEQDNA